MRPRARHHYDHRIRQAIVATGNPRLFPHLRIPPSTARTWISRGCPRVVADSTASEQHDDLQAELAKLRAEAGFYFALASVLRTFKLRLDYQRLPTASDKANLLRAINFASRSAPRARVLRIIGLSTSRFHAWQRRRLGCRLEDRSTCPRTHPTTLTAEEIQKIRGHVLDPNLRHMGLRALCLHAQRRGIVFASRSTWRRLIASRGWRRPRPRLHPPKPKLRLRASGPNQWWHLDLTVIRLLDGSKIYLHAVMDNFSRKVLAWEIRERVMGRTTTAILERAVRFLDDHEVKLMTDSGVENVNETVDELLAVSPLHRVLAQVDVPESNSMLEAFWRSLRHQWLYLHELDSLATVRKLVDFYVVEHNSVIPHAAFDGQTPDEIYFGRPSIAPELPAHRRAARSARLELNRSRSCESCSSSPSDQRPSDPQP